MKIASVPRSFAIAVTLLSGCFGFAQSQSALSEGFVDVPGAQIFYKDSGGRGAPVVFLHAFTGSADVWEHQIPAFTRAGYRFIAYDRRGFGRTVAAANGPASTAADDLLALVEHLMIQKFHLVANCGWRVCRSRFRDFLSAASSQLHAALLHGRRIGPRLR